jgi:hypothetical protein
MSHLPSGLPVEVAHEEALARFVLSSRYRKGTSEEGWRVLYPAFIPDPYNDLSVSRVTDLPVLEVGALGKPVAEKQGKTLYGAAKLSAGIVRANALDVVSDEPPLRHANIIAWPKDSDPKEQKARRQALATELAARSQYEPIDDIK